MKNSRLFVFAAALAAACLVPVSYAQPDGGGEKGPRHGERGPRAEKMAEHMAKQLNLTPEQDAKIKGFLEQERTQAEAIRNDASLSREQKMEKRKALRESTQKQVDSVLTPEQQAKAKEMRAKAKDKMGERMKERAERRGGKDGEPKN